MLDLCECDRQPSWQEFPTKIKIILITKVSFVISSFNYLVPLLPCWFPLPRWPPSSSLLIGRVFSSPAHQLPGPWVLNFWECNLPRSAGVDRAGAGCDVCGSSECRPQGQVGKGPGMWWAPGSERGRTQGEQPPWVWGLAPAPPQGPQPGPPRAKALPAPGSRLPAPARPSASPPFPLEKPEDSGWFLPRLDFGLECLQRGGLRRLSGGPCPLHTPPPVIRAAASLLLFVFPPQSVTTPSPLFTDADFLSGELLGPGVPGTACCPEERVAVATQNILSREVLRYNKHPPLQLALNGPWTEY